MMNSSQRLTHGLVALLACLSLSGAAGCVASASDADVEAEVGAEERAPVKIGEAVEACGHGGGYGQGFGHGGGFGHGYGGGGFGHGYGGGFGYGGHHGGLGYGPGGGYGAYGGGYGPSWGPPHPGCP